MLTFGLDTKSDFKISVDDTEINKDVKLVWVYIDNQLNSNIFKKSALRKGDN